MRALTYIGAEKITFPPKPDTHTGRHTYKRTDNSVYRVASLLIMELDNHSCISACQIFGSFDSTLFLYHHIFFNVDVKTCPMQRPIHTGINQKGFSDL